MPGLPAIVQVVALPFPTAGAAVTFVKMAEPIVRAVVVDVHIKHRSEAIVFKICPISVWPLRQITRGTN
jgi:hypothetical protein